MYEDRFANNIRNLDSSYNEDGRPKFDRLSDESTYLKDICLISQPKHMLWVLKIIVSMRRFILITKHMFQVKGRKINTILHWQSFLIWMYGSNTMIDIISTNNCTVPRLWHNT